MGQGITGSAKIEMSAHTARIQGSGIRAVARGGAIYMSGGSSNNQSTPRFVGCTIISNDVLSDYNAYRAGQGGGFSLEAEMRPTFVDCQIDSNPVAPGSGNGYGGAAV